MFRVLFKIVIYRHSKSCVEGTVDTIGLERIHFDSGTRLCTHFKHFIEPGTGIQYLLYHTVAGATEIDGDPCGDVGQEMNRKSFLRDLANNLYSSQFP